MLDERKLTVLRAIVDEFVTSHEPVGSKAIAQKHALGVSPATIRNDMAALEDEGYIAAPHTSAGRIPTDKGYRLFVDKLSAIKPLSSAERTAISQFLDQAVDLDDVMLRTTKLLAQLTKQVAVVQYPSLQLSRIRHVELVALPHAKIMVVVIADTGRVEQRIAELSAEISSDDLDHLRHQINSTVASSLFTDVPTLLAEFPSSLSAELHAPAVAIVACLLETLVVRPEERIVVSGTAHLARLGSDYSGSVAPLLEALEENVVLLRLLGEIETGDDLQVRIGHENHVDGLGAASVVSAGYGTTDHSIARLGVVGPTHMNYQNSMAAVTAVARYVGRIVTEA